MLIKDLIVVFFLWLFFYFFCGRLWDHNLNRKKDRTAFAIMQSILFEVLTNMGIIYMLFRYIKTVS